MSKITCYSNYSSRFITPSKKSIMLELNKKIFSILFFSILTAVIGVGIVTPLLPVYAHDIGASGIYIGLIFGVFSLSRTLFVPYFGRLSDKKGRKPFIIAGLVSYSIVSVGFLFSKNIGALITIRFIQGIASALIMPVCQAYIGDITPKGKEGFAMGMFNTSMFLGLSIGPIIGGFVKDYYNLNAAFLCMGFLSFTAFLICLFYLPPTASENIKNYGKTPAKWRSLIFEKNIAALYLFQFTYTTSIGIIWAFLPILADIEFFLPSFYTGLLVSLGVFISGIMHTPMGIVADKFNKRILVPAGGVIVTFAMLYFGRSTGFNNCLFASILFGIGGGISIPALMALAVIKGKDTGGMGSVISLITAAHSLGMLTGSLAAGLIADMLQLRHAFYFGACIMILGIILFLVLSNNTNAEG
ncbi:MAG: MFS transporter [Pseudomonadota bacterium]